MERKKLTIGHCFPEYLNMYGDKGNIKALVNRINWRNIDVEVIEISNGSDINFERMDIVLLGGGSEKDQRLVLDNLLKSRDELVQFVESNGIVLALCGSYPMLGRSFPLQGEVLEGLSVLDIKTEQSKERVIGDVVLSVQLNGEENDVVGFENHSGKTYIGSYSPFGQIKHGFGNNGEDGTCGVWYKNLLGTYLHGPLLPKNPKLCDFLIAEALKRKYHDGFILPPLDDEIEQIAHDYMVRRTLKG